jgi:hypothetical protein
VAGIGMLVKGIYDMPKTNLLRRKPAAHQPALLKDDAGA